jgi:PiT family inorganic phosphate transporter
MLIAILLITLGLAWANGANDNFKGVATLYGSGAAGYRAALAWATVTTVAGSLLSVVLATALFKNFGGGGIVPDALAKSPAFVLSVGLGGALTILAATWAGMPTSTTHALAGALLGAGLVADAGAVNWAGLWTKFLLPLLASPVMAVGLAIAVYGLLHAVRKRAGITYEGCVCATAPAAAAPAAPGLALPVVQAPGVKVDTLANCAADGRVVAGVPVKRGIDAAHFLSAGAVCFARALNDTPKVAALLMVGGALAPWNVPVVALAMAVGGVIGARRVALVMSKKITALNPGQGASASLVTALLVIVASRFGLPVSTTHVTVGSIFGIGLVSGQARWKTVAQILLAWVSTLPAGLALGAASYAAMRWMHWT